MWRDFLNELNWGTLVYIIIPAIGLILTIIGLITIIIGLITIIKWIF